MEAQTIATLAVPLVGYIGSWLKRLSLHSRAEVEISRADDLRRLGAGDVAEEHEQRAREFLLRPAVMARRAVLGPAAPADLWTFGLVIAAAVLTLGFGDWLPALLLAFVLGMAAFVVIIGDSVAIDRECQARAATYDSNPPDEVTSTSRARRVALALLTCLLLFMRR